MKDWKRLCFGLTVLILLAIALPSGAQPEADVANSSVEMADVMRQEGKIYVVVAGIVLLLTGFIVYIVRVDRKVSQLEKELDNLS